MSAQLHLTIQNILNMPYFKNEHVRSGVTKIGHEEAVAQKFSESGFISFEFNDKPKLIKKTLKTWAEFGNDDILLKIFADMPHGSFILQPAGTQSFPDILLRDFSGKFVSIECKSTSKSVTPMWNDNVPQPNTIYVFSTGKFKENSTTVFLGKDVISAETLKLLKEQEKAMNALAKSFEEKLKKSDQFNRGWIQKSRRQHFQQGGNAFTDWFSHSSRKKCESNVLEFALDQ